MKKYNFNAGPSILPREVIENTAKQILDFNGIGLSLAEISHRSKDFQPVVDEAVALIKELLDVPEGYSVLFLGGGASLEFCMIPYNFLIKKAAYLNTGTWAKKAMKEAKLFGEVVEVASSADANYTFIPKDWTCPTDVDYLHITTNNTNTIKELSADFGDILNNETNCPTAKTIATTIVITNNTYIQLSNKPVYIGSFRSVPSVPGTIPPKKNRASTTILIMDAINNVQLDNFLIFVTAIVLDYFLNFKLYFITISSNVIEASSIWFKIASNLLNK